MSLIAGVTALAQAIAADFKALYAGKVDKVAGKGLSTNDFTPAEKDRLQSIASGATVNQTDAYLLARTNHTGAQAVSTVTGLQGALDAKEPTVAGSTATTYWNGLKGWSDFAGSARQALLSGIVFTTSTAVVAGDTLLTGLGKLQAQLNAIPATITANLRRFNGEGAAVTGNTTLDNTFAGKWVSVTATGAVVTLPSAADMQSGQTIRILNRTNGDITLLPQATQGVVIIAISYASVTLRAGEWFEVSANTGNTAWYATGRGFMDTVSLLPALASLGSENHFYNSAMRLAITPNLADGWKFDVPGAPGASTGVMTLVPSFMSADEKAQRMAVTGLNNSALYRSLTNDAAYPYPQIMEGQDATVSVYVKGTAGLGLRIFFQAISASVTVLNTINSLVTVLDGTAQRVSLTFANLPAGTVRVHVFYRVYASTVTDGTVDLARPQVQIGPLSGWTEDTRTLNATKAPLANPAFTGGMSLTQGELTISQNGLAADTNLTVTGDAGRARNIRLRTGNSGRWDIICNEVAESGSNAGSNLVILARSDTGAYLRTPLQIDRAGGMVTLSALAVSAAATVNSNLTVGGNLEIVRSTGDPTLIINGVAGTQKGVMFRTSGSERWRLGANTSAESGANAGTDFFLSRYSDAGAGISTPVTVSRATGRTTLALMTVNGEAVVAGPLQCGQYTLTTLPSAATYNGYTIDVTNATGGPKQCRSNGTNWLITNTSTVVS